MNVTPLVDVVLVLLIIFMVVAPRMDQDVQVNLPGIFNPDPEVDAAADPLKVSVDQAGQFYIDDQKLDLDAAIDTLSARHAEDPLRRLVLRADSKLTYGQVRQILSRSQAVGFPGVSLMVGEKNRPGRTTPPAAASPAGDTPGEVAGAAKEG
jgi:biopolymer transport protein ExbD/biopolymer transport protein TolR